MEWVRNKLSKVAFTSASVPGVKVLENDHRIVNPGWKIENGPGKDRQKLESEDKNKLPPDTYVIYDHSIVGTNLKKGTPYTEITIRNVPNKLFIIDGKQYLISESTSPELMYGGRRKKRRTMRRKNKARSQSRKFR